MDTYTKRYLWCERTEKEYMEIQAEIEKRRAGMLALYDEQGWNWPARKRELEDWLERGSEYIEKYRNGVNRASWKNICDTAQQGWNALKVEIQEILDEIP